MKVAVILCSCIHKEGIVPEEVIHALQKYDPDVQIIFIQDLCTTFPEHAECLATWKLQATVLPDCCRERNASLRQAQDTASFHILLKQAGLQPFSVELLASPLRKGGTSAAGGTSTATRPPFQNQEITETFIRLALAAILRAKARAGLTPEYLKLAPLPSGQVISRRDLLFSLLQRHYEVVPTVDASFCTVSTGCRLCLSACPEGAILFQEEQVTIKKESCTGCGLCLPICPQQAILFPPFSPKELDTQLALLLDKRKAECPLQEETTNKVLLFACQQVASPWMTVPFADSSLQILDLRLPTLALLTSFLLLKALSLGAVGIIFLRCNAQACTCHHPRFQDMLSFSEALLTALGIEGLRFCLLDTNDELEEALSGKLQTFLKMLEQFFPPFPQEETLREAVLATSDLASLLKVLLGSISPLCERLIGESERPLRGAPFGLLTLQGSSHRPSAGSGQALSLPKEQAFCTFCGICPNVCPTQALTITEEGGYSLNFTHALCVACGECTRQCPEQVLSLETGVDFPLLQKGSLSLAKDEMVHCRECREEIAPASMLAKVQAKLSEKNSQQDLRLLCPTCRLKKSLYHLTKF